MKKAGVLSILFVLVLLAVAVIVEAQQPKKVSRIGFVLGSGVLDPRFEAFRGGLQELGYNEEENILIEYRQGWDRSRSQFAELVQAKNVTRTIPIVFLSVSGPVGDGLVDSLARPGGNITGFTTKSNN